MWLWTVHNLTCEHHKKIRGRRWEVVGILPFLLEVTVG
jgi:hypothetical protein